MLARKVGLLGTINNRITRAMVILVLVSTAVAVSPHGNNCSFEGTYKMVTVRHLKTVIHSAVANTEPLRELGLGNRDCMPANQGMLFVFTRPDTYGFWMKDMRFPIDIVWLNQDKKIVSITRSIDPSSYPASFMPEAPAMYVLELPNNKANLYGFTKGMQLNWDH